MQNPVLLRPEQVADMLGIGRTFVYELMATGRLESLKLNRRRLVPRDALDAFIAAERERQAAENEAVP